MLTFLCGTAYSWNVCHTCRAKSCVISGRTTRVDVATVNVKYKVVPTCEMTEYGGMSVKHRSFLTSKLHAVVCGRLQLRLLYHGEKHPSVNLIRGWISPAAGRDVTSVTYSTGRWLGDRGGTGVKVLRYKSEGRWFDPRWCHWNFSLT